MFKYESCTKCGACCKMVNLIGDVLPYKEDGSCKFLIEGANQTQICSIFEFRPNICRYGFFNTLLDTPISQENYLTLTQKQCIGFQEKFNIPQHLRLKNF